MVRGHGKRLRYLFRGRCMEYLQRGSVKELYRVFMEKVEKMFKINADLTTFFLNWVYLKKNLL